MGALITHLCRSGELFLFRDYRSGTLWDWSGNGFAGTPGSLALVRGPRGTVARFDDASGVDAVADDPILRVSAGTILVFGQFNNLSRATYDTLVAKRDAGGTNYDFRLQPAPELAFYDGLATRSVAFDYRGYTSLGVTFENGSQPEFWADALSVGTAAGNAIVSEDDAELNLGNIHALNRSCSNNPLHAVVLCNRILDGDEIAAVVSEVLG